MCKFVGFLLPNFYIISTQCFTFWRRQLFPSLHHGSVPETSASKWEVFLFAANSFNLDVKEKWHTYSCKLYANTITKGRIILWSYFYGFVQGIRRVFRVFVMDTFITYLKNSVVVETIEICSFTIPD